MSDPTATQTGVVIAILTALGGAVKWLISWKDGHVSKLEKRIEALEARDAERSEKLDKLWLAFSLVAADLRKHNPASEALAMAGRLLRDKFPVDADVPADMHDLLKRMP